MPKNSTFLLFSDIPTRSKKILEFHNYKGTFSQLVMLADIPSEYESCKVTRCSNKLAALNPGVLQ